MVIANKSIRALAVLVLLGLAILLFAFGLLAPLTPSEGAASIGALISFWLVPILMVASIFWIDRSRTARVLATIELLGIFLFGAWVLWATI